MQYELKVNKGLKKINEIESGGFFLYEGSPCIKCNFSILDFPTSFKDKWIAYNLSRKMIEVLEANTLVRPLIQNNILELNDMLR